MGRRADQREAESATLKRAGAEVKAPGLLIVVSGPSGVGKGSILAEAAGRLPNLVLSISVTTRPPRPNEAGGKDYFFRSQEQFDQMRQTGEFLEWARYLNNYYGTPRSWVVEKLQAGKDVALEIDVQGGMQVRESLPEAVLIFVTPTGQQGFGPRAKAELRARLMGRSTETAESVERRLSLYTKELEFLRHYDYEIVNERLEDAVDLFCCIVLAEKAKLSRKARDE